MNDDDLTPIEPEPAPEPPPEVPAATPPTLTPLKESAGTRFAESAGRGCLGTVSFVVALLVFGTTVVANQLLGLAFSIIVVVGLFTARKRSGPSPMLGAVAVGAAIALVLAGSCAILMMIG
jgi:hypothetical protein